MKNNKLSGVLFLQKCIIVREDLPAGRQVLALKRSETKDSDRSSCWDLPGGTYERGEDVINSIKREVMEEVSLTIIDPIPIYLASGLDNASQFMSSEVVFAVTHVCTKWTGEVIISDEHVEFRWVTPEDFMAYDFGDDGGFFAASIKAYLANNEDK